MRMISRPRIEVDCDIENFAFDQLVHLDAFFYQDGEVFQE
jgi:hypothetical protein